MGSGAIYYYYNFSFLVLLPRIASHRSNPYTRSNRHWFCSDRADAGGLVCCHRLSLHIFCGLHQSRTPHRPSSLTLPLLLISLSLRRPVEITIWQAFFRPSPCSSSVPFTRNKGSWASLNSTSARPDIPPRPSLQKHTHASCIVFLVGNPTLQMSY